MRIGILRADAVDTDLASRHGDYPDMFRALLSAPGVQGGGARAQFVDIDAHRGALPDPTLCDAYLITGSRHSVYDDLPWIGPLAEFINTALANGRRVVGICFGHQLLAHCFGGRVAAAPSGWCVGVHCARVVERPAWMDPPARGFRLLVSHRDQVERLPSAARCFAASEQCPVAGFVMGDALAIQGHPEFLPGYAGELMDVRRHALGDDVYRAGKASLTQDTDSPLVARWMLAFMSRGRHAGATP